jgi:HPt (histidine-containing phosphotransfer) domain-containing protein
MPDSIMRDDASMESPQETIMIQAYDPSSTPILDGPTMEQLLALDDGQLGLIREMFQLYQDDTPDRIKALEVMAAETSYNDVAEVAHAVKGAASTMGAPRAQAVAAVLEAAGRRGEMPKAEMETLIQQLRSCFQESVEALGLYIASKEG